MAFTTWATNDVITAAKLNNDNTVAVGTDTARTVTVTHSWTASQTFTGGWTAAAACTVSTGGLTVTAGGLTVTAGGETITAGGLTVTAGNIGIGGAAQSKYGVVVTGVVLATAQQVGFRAEFTASASCTDFMAGVNINLTTSTAAYTVTTCYGVNINNPTLGAGSAITTQYGLNIEDQTRGSTNYAIYTNAGIVRFGGTVYVGDTTNANVTLGLTLNQGTADDQIFALKSSTDVDHGVTDVAETDTFGAAKKASATDGGLNVIGLTQGTYAVYVTAIGTTEDATRSTAAVATTYIDNYKKSGTASAALAADKNMLAIGNAGTTRFIFDTDGSAHGDVEWIAF